MFNLQKPTLLGYITGGARVDKETEHNGLDETIHGETVVNN